MRFAARARWLLSLWLGLLLGCKSERPLERAAPANVSRAPLGLASARSSSPRPISSAVVAFEQQLQAGKLRLPPLRPGAPRLAFAKGVLAQLGDDALRIFAADQPRLLLSEPLEQPRAVVALADGSLAALGSKRLLYWQPGWKHAKSLPRPTLLPGAEIYADALRPDVLWVYDAGTAQMPGRLSSFRLGESDLPLLLAEQTLELERSPDAVLGSTREAVWLYLTPGHAERFAPSGARLGSLELDSAPLPFWVLPALRLDQSLWLSEAGEVARVQVSPSFRRLSRVSLSGRVFTAALGDEGRLLAVVLVTGAGPRFELELLDSELHVRGRAPLPADAPTGADDWVQQVSRNQELSVSARAGRVAVGGPARVSIFDAQARLVFSISSQ